ncbi:hypothetical protein R8Z50_25630 [Longispora sp. K20-0274]|uniref:hypothetical protein n=1 Tax=Longispora sp. K20-0274 TaxID=3088255 RepID=UPI00399B94F1
MRNSTIELELAGWQRQGTELASVLRRHMGVDGLCPVCVGPDGAPCPDPCALTAEARTALRHLCGDQ